MRTRRHRERNVTFCCVSPCYLDSNEDSGFLTLFLYAFCWCEWELKTLLFFFPPAATCLWHSWHFSLCCCVVTVAGVLMRHMAAWRRVCWRTQTHHTDREVGCALWQSQTRQNQACWKKNILVSLWKKVIIIKWESNVLDKKWHGIEKSTIAWYTVTIMR